MKTQKQTINEMIAQIIAEASVADGLFCREIDGLFCRSSPDSVVRRRCVLSLPSCFVI